MKEQMLVPIKEQLRSIADNLTIENHQQMKTQVDHIFNILQAASQLMEFDFPKQPEPQAIIPAVEDEPTPESSPEDVPIPVEEPTMEELLEEEKEEESVPTYVFERKIRGGMLQGDIDAFVPESIVRDLDLHHGDIMTAKLISRSTHGPDRYEYELVERMEGPSSPPEIVEINMGIVTYEPNKGGFCVKDTQMSEEGVVSDEPSIFPIKGEDIDQLDIRQGDVISCAYYTNNPSYVRARWKYSSEEVDQSSEKRKSSYYKDRNKQEKSYSPIFEGKTIGVLGFEPGWPTYKEEIEKRAGSIVTLTGKESSDRLESIVTHADCFILLTNYVSHRGTTDVVKACKKHDIPQSELQTFGRTSFINLATDLLECETDSLHLTK